LLGRLYFNFENDLADLIATAVTVEVYIWSLQATNLPAANIVFNNVKRYRRDKYIALEFHNEIKAFITASN
jgi:hypothetical protein